MTPERRQKIARDIERAKCPEFLAGYVWALRSQGELAAVADLVAEKLRRTGWAIDPDPFADERDDRPRRRR